MKIKQLNESIVWRLIRDIIILYLQGDFVITCENCATLLIVTRPTSRFGSSKMSSTEFIKRKMSLIISYRSSVILLFIHEKWQSSIEIGEWKWISMTTGNKQINHIRDEFMLIDNDSQYSEHWSWTLCLSWSFLLGYIGLWEWVQISSERLGTHEPIPQSYLQFDW